MNVFNRDHLFGINKENELFDIIKTEVCTSLKKTKPGSVFDYEGDNVYVELKSRRNPKDQYADTMIGANKIKHASEDNSGCEYHFFFCFTDGIYSYKFNKEDLINGVVSTRKGGRVDRNRNEIKDYCFIQTSALKIV